MDTGQLTKKIIVASHNAGKIREITELLGPFGFEILSASQLGLAEPEETGLSFADNAILKARAAALACNEMALSDDSGLCVEALDGAPGIYSARWAGSEKDFNLAMRKIEDEIGKKGANASRRAHFFCALALAMPDQHIEVFEGRVDGMLIWPPRGERGFGYDPMFVADGETESFGEMDPARKHAMSHRARAFAKLKAHLVEDIKH